MMTQSDVMEWLQGAEHGDEIVYFTGPRLSTAPYEVRMAGQMLRAMAEEHRPGVVLFQRRRSAKDFDHVARKVKR